MKFNLRNLMLCITHDCNGECAFCMRGELQKFYMPASVIKKIFSQTSYVEHIGITGGEPSLCPTGIKCITYYAKKYGCEIGSFFCATNGLVYSEEFVSALDELYSYCTNKQLCELTLSIDQFHKSPDEKEKAEYEKLAFYNTSKNKGMIAKKDILSEGRAEQNGLGRYSNPPVKEIYDYSVDGFVINIGDRIFINACGDIVLDADLSYEHQAERRIGNVMDDDLYDIFRHSFYKIPEYWIGENQKSFYKILLKADMNTLLIEPTVEESYLELPQEASVAYQSILRNIRMMPMDFTEKTVPDDLELIYEDLPIEENRCIGTKIYYKSSTISEGRAVTVEVIRCPLMEGTLYGRKR